MSCTKTMNTDVRLRRRGRRAGRAALFPGAALCALVSGCGVLRERPPDDTDLSRAALEPMPPEQAEAVLSTAGENWVYGRGMGETAATVGGIVLFPIYGLWVLGNGILSLSGYEELRVSDALPEETRQAYLATYDGLTSVPGRIAATVGEHEYVNDDVAADRMRAALRPLARDGTVNEAPPPEGAAVEPAQPARGTTQEHEIVWRP